MKLYSRRVRYYETDQMGVVHHSNYIRFFEEARMDYWEQAGLDYLGLEQDGILVPVLSCSCRYKKPLRFPQEFAVEVKVTAFNGVRFRLNYRILVEGEKHPVATGDSEHCFADLQLKPLRIAKYAPHLATQIQATLPSSEAPVSPFVESV